jgi:hypothetical protein
MEVGSVGDVASGVVSGVDLETIGELQKIGGVVGGKTFFVDFFDGIQNINVILNHCFANFGIEVLAILLDFLFECLANFGHCHFLSLRAFLS